MNGARVLTPAVRPQADGIHLEVRNDTGKDLGFSMLGEQGGGRGDDAPAGSATYVWPLHPGKFFVACEDGIVDPSDVVGTPIEVVDEEGLWVSTELSRSCERASTTHADYVEGAQGEKDDPVPIARRLFDEQGTLQPGDVVEPAGYLEDEEAIVRLIRDGEVVATVRYLDDALGGWLPSETTVCEDAPAPHPESVEIVGGSEPQQALLRDVLVGMGTTRIEKISIEGPDKDWKPFEEGDIALVVSVAPSQQMDVRGRWEAWLLAGVFRDRSREAGLPSVIVLDLEGVDAGRIDATDTEPISGAGSDDVRALTRLIHRASEEGGSHVDEFAILQPYGLAPAVMMKTAEPARFLKEQLPKFLKAFGDP